MVELKVVASIVLSASYPSQRQATKEISFEIIRKDGKSQSLDKPRHLAIYSGSDQRFVYSSNCQHEHINAHSLFFDGIGNSVNNNNPLYLKTFELLKILDFENLPLKNLPETIGLLTRLRYLGLRNTSIKSLPHSIGKLKNLEVLDIARVYKVKVGDVIREMESLRHIHAGFFYSVDRLKTDTLKNLQTLGYIYAGNLIPEQVKKMRALRKLSLFITRDLGFKGSEFFRSLATLENLVCLELKWGPPDSIQPSH
ncbi:PREDICTED: putative disease resistance protein RGA4 [Erythranthe guttata]|uniref:putative disease resistance protein RGA4 n=1 Tax=Erythranthe guttata TaxID=4155 RepID=UPI00064DFE7D|nr:PREDICTED: putative disease resistance protein RGA4 [Erythranthe guttata]|eukprot:XP_012834482.1 PREDICTED: putative disease resistance protein RGA4 [Erythranthe guttata]